METGTACNMNMVSTSIELASDTDINYMEELYTKDSSARLTLIQ